jgi:uncharacterized protein YjbI with pentapeptide repeats
MADKKHLEILEQGVETWNKWREENPYVRPDLSKANLEGAMLSGAVLFTEKANLSETDLSEANLSEAYLIGANLIGANLIGANLSEANLSEAYLSRANLSKAFLIGADLSRADLIAADLGGALLNGANLIGADLRGANLSDKANLVGANLAGANLSGAFLSEANLSWADLRQAILIRTNLEGTELTNCRIYGISAWDLKLGGAKQSDLIISDYNDPIITVDNLQVAQFIYLLLNNEEIRDVIDTITSKVVLILGRFTDKRKPILDAIREELRNYNYLPVLFDFEKPISKTFIDTVGTLAHMARFVIADVTDPKIVLDEVPHVVRNITVPVIPLLLEGEQEPTTIPDLRKGHRLLLDTHYYKDREDLIASLEEKVITPAETKAKELRSQ